MKRIKEWLNSDGIWLDAEVKIGLLPAFVILSIVFGAFLVVLAVHHFERWVSNKPTPQPQGTFIGPCPIFVELPVWEWDDVERIGRRLPAFDDSICVRIRWEELD